MSSLARTPCLLVIIAALGGDALWAVDLEGLVKNSPFGGTGTVAGPGAAPSTLEFRGMYAEAGVNYYSIYNTQTKQSSWVTEGEAASVNVPVVIKGFDLANEALVIDNAGQPQQMALHQSVVITYRGPSTAQLAAVSAAAVSAAQAPLVGGATTGIPANPTPEQVEAFRQSMRERFGRDGKGGGPDNGRSRGGDNLPSNAKAVDAPTTKPPKTPKVR